MKFRGVNRTQKVWFASVGTLKRRDRDLPSMRQMKAKTEKPLSPEFQANRSMLRYIPESRHFALDFTADTLRILISPRKFLA